MRLSCPNCGTHYKVPESAIPAAGQHVQCTECHTRWFARGPQPATRLTEEQILARLETRKPLTLVSGGASRTAKPAPVAKAEPEADPGPGFVWEGRVEPPAPALKPAQAPAGEALPPSRAEAPRPRRRFTTGLLLALALAALALAIYLAAEAITAQLPSAEPVIGSYARAIDEARAGIKTAASLRG